MSSTDERVERVLAALRQFPLLKNELSWYMYNEKQEYKKLLNLLQEAVK